MIFYLKLFCDTDTNTVLIILREWLNCITLVFVRNTRSINTILFHQSVLNNISTSLRNLQVVCFRTCSSISITCDDNLRIRILFHILNQVFQLSIFLLRNCNRVDLEEDIATIRLFYYWSWFSLLLYWSRFNNFLFYRSWSLFCYNRSWFNNFLCTFA